MIDCSGEGSAGSSNDKWQKGFYDELLCVNWLFAMFNYNIKVLCKVGPPIDIFWVLAMFQWFWSAVLLPTLLSSL